MTRTTSTISLGNNPEPLSLWGRLQGYFSPVIAELYGVELGGLPVPLKLAVTPQTLTYNCAIAPVLASKLGQSPGSIAQTILGHITQNSAPGEFPTVNATIAHGGDGYFAIAFDPVNLLRWLHQWPPTLPDFPRVSPSNLHLLEAHGRSRSILHLAQREGLLPPRDFMATLVGLTFTLADWPLWQAIAQFLDHWDRQGPHSPQLEKMLIQIGDRVFEFDRHCRIFGEITRDNLPLSRARLMVLEKTRQLLAPGDLP